MLNYYQHHIGDHAAATLHLSWDEDCAYRRLLDQYYKRELPIPADLKEACRLARATTPAQKGAVDKVLREFFTRTAEGWTRPQCQQEIATFKQGEPAREAAKTNRNTRAIRHREQREALFAALEAVGQEPPWNLPMAELRELAKRHCKTVSGAGPVTPVTPPETSPVPSPETLQERSSNAPDTASHSQFPFPIPISQSDSPETDMVELERSTTRAAKPAAKKKPNGHEPDPRFVDFQAAYPPRAGDQGWAAAAKRCRQRLAEGSSWEQIIDGATRYAAYVRATDALNTQYVKSACVFVGPEKHFLKPWTPPATKAQRRQDENVSVTQQWLAKQEADDAKR